MLGWVHVGVPTVLVAVHFSNDLLHQWVFEDDIAEALIVDGLEDSVLVRPLKAKHIEKVQPEVLNLETCEVDQFKVLAYGYDHLVEGHWAFWVLLDVELFFLFLKRCRCGGWGSWPAWAAISVRSHVAIQELVLIQGLGNEFLLHFTEDSQDLIDKEVEQALSVNWSIEVPLNEDFHHCLQGLDEFLALVLTVVVLEQ